MHRAVGTHVGTARIVLICKMNFDITMNCRWCIIWLPDLHVAPLAKLIQIKNILYIFPIWALVKLQPPILEMEKKFLSLIKRHVNISEAFAVFVWELKKSKPLKIVDQSWNTANNSQLFTKIFCKYSSLEPALYILIPVSLIPGSSIWISPLNQRRDNTAKLYR